MITMTQDRKQLESIASVLYDAERALFEIEKPVARMRSPELRLACGAAQRRIRDALVECSREVGE